jgi:hypothetical protein
VNEGPSKKAPTHTSVSKDLLIKKPTKCLKKLKTDIRPSPSSPDRLRLP